jgi:hypothetical protein
LETPKPRALAERLKLRSYCLTLSADAGEPQQRRRWFRFSLLRTCFTPVTVAGFALGWLAWKIEHRPAKPAMEPAIFVHQGVFARRQSLSHFAIAKSPSLSAPAAWERELFGDDLNGSISGISFVGASATDADMRRVTAMDGLEYISLRGSPVTDAGLSKLKRLTDLKLLDLSGTKVTDAGLTELTRLTRLRYLDLTETRVTDTGVSALQESLPNCHIVR